MFTAGCKASGPPGPPLHPPWNPRNIQPSQGTGQGVRMTFNASSRLRSLEDRSAALGSSRCELPGMHSVPKSAVLPYASGVGGLSRRLLNKNLYIYIYMYTRMSTTSRGFFKLGLRRFALDHLGWCSFYPKLQLRAVRSLTAASLRKESALTQT